MEALATGLSGSPRWAVARPSSPVGSRLTTGSVDLSARHGRGGSGHCPGAARDDRKRTKKSSGGTAKGKNQAGIGRDKKRPAAGNHQG